MTSRTRLWVLVVSTPVIAFAIIGGYLGQAMTRDETIRNLRIFQDVVDLVDENYVEQVDMRKAMAGALRGLTDALDADSAYLTPQLVKTYESNAALPAGDLGLDIIRNYYLRIVSARDGSPAAKAGLRAGDYIRAIDGRPTRDMSAFEGARLLRGSPGSKVALLVFRGNAAEPTEMAVVRERIACAELTTRMANPSTGYVRVLDFTADSPSRIKQAFDALARTGARRYVVDLRSTSRGDVDHGIAAARLFVRSATLAIRQTKAAKDVVTAAADDGAITAPVVLLVDHGTAGAAEVFAAALDNNKRAELIGGRTLGRAARQQLVKLPDGSGLLISSTRYLSPSSEAIHEKGLTPDVAVEQPDVELGADAPPGDPTLDKALERLAEPKAA
jgi:carboxyl-terminal processing protease